MSLVWLSTGLNSFQYSDQIQKIPVITSVVTYDWKKSNYQGGQRRKEKEREGQY